MLLAETFLHGDWHIAVGLLVAAWSLAVVRNEIFEKTNAAIVGATIARIPIPWSFFSFSPKVTKWAFAVLAIMGAFAFMAGLAGAVVDGDVIILSNSVLLLTLAFAYCKRPYTLILGAEGLSWHGKSYRWREVTAWVDQAKRVFQIRVMANEQNQLYGAVNYLDLSNVSDGNVELLGRVAAENSRMAR
jgi:hypothetical protein